MLSHIKSNDNHWTVILDNKPHIFDGKHPEYTNLVAAVQSGNADWFNSLITVGTAIENWSDGNFEFRDGHLFFEGEQVARQPTERIINLQRDGWDHNFMLSYLSNLYKNVSNRAVQESYSWSMHKGLPITEDGMMIGYKGVATYRSHGTDKLDKNKNILCDGDLVDKYTGCSHRNNVGDIPHMPRRQVCDDVDQGCGQGLHIGTYEYACSWAGSDGTVVLVKFNPANIVSVPKCSEFSKMRVSTYEVLSIARGRIEDAVYDSDSNGDEYDENGYDDNGYDEDGCNEAGYDKDGLDCEGYNSDGYDEEGYDSDGFDFDGLDPEGYNREGLYFGFNN